MSRLLRLALWVGMVAVLAPVHALGQAARYEKSVPPEILAMYEPSVVSGERPRTVTITQQMIWQLRERPHLGGDVYVLDMDFSQLSTVQRNILINWLEKGAKVLLWGEEMLDAVPCLVPGATVGWSRPGEVCQLAEHPVNTDCRLLSFECSEQGLCRGVQQCPVKMEAIAGTPSVTVAGRIPVKLGSIYFASFDASEQGRWQQSPDRDRWTLNFKQWLLGLPVPRAAETRVALVPGSPGPLRTRDRILLTNGDIVSGTLLTPAFEIRTDYANLRFAVESISSIYLNSGATTYEVIILRNGDRLSGEVRPVTVKLKLELNEELELPKTKIREIACRQ